MTYGDLINSYSTMLKVGFIPNPQAQQSDQLMQQVMQIVQSLPPEVQQQVMPQMQQISQMTPDQQLPALQQLGQQLSQMGQQQQAPQQGSDQGQGQQNPPQVPQGQGLDTVVQCTVRELLDLASGGDATKSKLQIEALKDKHEAKKQQNAQKQQQAQQDQAAAQGQGPDLQGGGVYPQQAPQQ